MTAEARVWLSRALEAAGEPVSIDGAMVVARLGSCAQQEGDFGSARKLTAQALGRFESLGEEARAIDALNNLAFGAFSVGEVEQARIDIAEARRRAERIDDEFRLAQVLSIESLVETHAGDYDRAQVELEEALFHFRGAGAPHRLWLAHLINVGWIALHRRDFGRAREALEEYLAAESWKNPVGIANGHCNLGLVALYEGDRDEADVRCRQALVLARSPRARTTIAEALHGLGAVAAMDGDGERAMQLWGAAGSVKEAMQTPMTAPEEFIVERYLAPAAAGLPESLRDRARAEGTAMSQDEAIALALEI